MFYIIYIMIIYIIYGNLILNIYIYVNITYIIWSFIMFKYVWLQLWPGILSIPWTISGRLTPEIISSCLGSDTATQSDGMNVVSTLRDIKLKLSACIPLVQSLSATQGEFFHHAYLQSSISQARAAGVVASTAIDCLMGVRHISALAEAMDWVQLSTALTDGLVSSGKDEANALRQEGLVHAVEFIMRGSVGNPSETSEEAVAKRTSIGLEKIKHMRSLLDQVLPKDLWSTEQLEKLRQELEQLSVLLKFAEEALSGPQSWSGQAIRDVESARTIVTAKGSVLLKCMSCLPFGLWLSEIVQDQLAEYHSQNTLVAALEKAFLSTRDYVFYFCIWDS